MRLFVAFEVPEPVRREVRRRMAGLRERLPRARWVNPDVMHLTLLFIGEVATERVAALAGALGAAFAPFPPLALRLSGAGTFPAGRPARVAWVGVAAPPEIVPLQAAAARAALAAVGLPPPDDRPYRPHVTLARCPSPWPRGAAEKFAGAFPGEVGPPFVVRQGALIESRLGPQGPRYRDLAELPLAGAAAGADAAAAGAHESAPGAHEPAAGAEERAAGAHERAGDAAGAGDPVPAAEIRQQDATLAAAGDARAGRSSGGSSGTGGDA